MHLAHHFQSCDWAAMKQAKLRAIAPVWAQRIEVETRGDVLLITGWGHISGPIDTREIESGHISKLDILKRFHRYVLSHLNKKGATGDAGVYQFADATDDERLIAFCQEFGPVWGKVRSCNHEDDGTTTLTVAQGMKQLRKEQRKFAATVRLLQQVNQPGRADRSAMIHAMNDLHIVDPKILSWLWVLSELPSSVRSRTEKVAVVLPFAHFLFCELLNDVPPKLAPLNGEVIELPYTRDEGIRSALYYPLRRDYLAQREIRNCLHCGSHFSVFKRGARACSQTCRAALRNQKYWSENKEVVNRNRRKKRTGRN
jgi:hypothetical protein